MGLIQKLGELERYQKIIPNPEMNSIRAWIQNGTSVWIFESLEEVNAHVPQLTFDEELYCRREFRVRNTYAFVTKGYKEPEKCPASEERCSRH